MKVSFLVTYYNQAQYVRKSLDSILAIQKDCDWDILIGDDGSTDETVSIINEYIEKYPEKIKLFIMPREKDNVYQPVLRVSLNRLNLVEHCNSDYFCIIDGDDYYCNSNFLKKGLEKFNNPLISVVAFKYQKVNSNDEYEQVNTIDVNANTVVTPSDYLKKCYIHFGACIFLNTFKNNPDSLNKLKHIGFYDDEDIILNAFNYGQLFYIDDVIYSYRQTSNGWWSSGKKLDLNIISLISYDIELKIAPDFYKDLYFRYYITIIKIWLLRKKLHSLITEQKITEYEKLLSGIQKTDSLSYNMINYKSCSLVKRIQMNIQICIFIFNHPKFILRNFPEVLKWRKNVINK